MAKKKWYVVTAGKAVGVYAYWLEVAPLVVGVSGARHQSFRTEEEAKRVFEWEKAKGNIEVIDGSQSGAQMNSPMPSPPSHSHTMVLLQPSQTTHLDMYPPKGKIRQMNSTRFTAQGSRSSPALSSPVTSSTSRIEFSNQAGPSAPKTSEAPYPSESLAAACTSSLLYSANNPGSTSTSSSPPTGVTQVLPLLSPLNCSELRVQEDLSWCETYERTSHHSLPMSPTHESLVNPNTASTMDSSGSGHRQRRHTFPHRIPPLLPDIRPDHVSDAVAFGFSQSVRARTETYESAGDPRSPMTDRTSVPAISNPSTFARPSPDMPIHELASTLRIR